MNREQARQVGLLNPKRERLKKILPYLLLCAITVTGRVAYVIYDQSYNPVAGAEMERAAVSIANYGMIGNIYTDSSGKSAHVAPLYPLFLASVYWLFGWSALAARIAQEACAIAATTIALALLPSLAKRTDLSVAAAWIAAFALAALPINLWVETSGSWEQPYAALALLCLVFWFCRLQNEAWQRPRTAVLTGVCLGLASLLSPILLPAGVLMAGTELWAADGSRRVLTGCLTMAGITGLVLLPWTVRNYFAVGGFVPLRSNFGLELAIGNNDSANGKTFVTEFDDRQNPMMAMHPFTNPGERSRLLRLGEIGYMHERQQEAFRWIEAHPEKTLQLTWRRFILFWFPPQDLWSASSRSRRLKSATFDLIGLATLAELIWLAAIKHRRAGLLAMAVVGPTLPYMVTHVDPRYRYPIFALSALLAFDLVFRIRSQVRRIGSSRRLGSV